MYRNTQKAVGCSKIEIYLYYLLHCMCPTRVTEYFRIFNLKMKKIKIKIKKGKWKYSSVLLHIMTKYFYFFLYNRLML